MRYQEALAEVGSTHQAQIEADLTAARQDQEDARSALDAAERRVHTLESLLAMRGGPPDLTEGADGTKMTLHAAMHKVLTESPQGRLRAGEIIAEIERRGLYRMRDGRVPESQQVHARAGHYPDLIGKDGSYFYAK